MNKQIISTIIASAALGILRSVKKNSGNKNQDVTIYNIDDLKKYANDPQLAQTVNAVLSPGERMTEIPSEIGKLINLKVLDLSDNTLTEMPREIGKLINLQHLFLNENQIEEIPKEIGNLVNLKTLNLEDNQITSLPKEIGNLINLRELYLKENSIQSPTQEELINLWIPAGFSSKVAELFLPYLPSEQSSIRRF